MTNTSDYLVSKIDRLFLFTLQRALKFSQSFSCDLFRQLKDMPKVFSMKYLLERLCSLFLGLAGHCIRKRFHCKARHYLDL